MNDQDLLRMQAMRMLGAYDSDGGDGEPHQVHHAGSYEDVTYGTPAEPNLANNSSGDEAK